MLTLVRALAVLLLIFVASRCERRTSTAKTSHATRALPSLPLQLELPDDATVRGIGGGTVIVIHPGQRNPLRIEIKRADPDVFIERGAKKRSLTPQLQLIYREEVQAGGSGGDEATLDGELTFGSDRYRVTCHLQSEYAPSATDCLPVLATLRAMTR
jgi:hypothetical protein